MFIIAEIGNNHEGSIQDALEAIRRAKDCGADAVKFQAITPELLVSKIARSERVAQLEKICLPIEKFHELKDEASKCKIKFGVSIFDHVTLERLPELDFVKIASSEMGNWRLMEGIIAKYSNIIISTGTTSSNDMLKLTELIKKHNKKNFSILHCMSQYPTEVENANLSYLDIIRSQFDCRIGYSDHTDNLLVNLMALAKGATVFEKHFTLDRARTGIKDHQLSSDPKSFKIYCETLRQYQTSLGDGIIDARVDRVGSTSSELKRSYYATRNLSAGSIISENDIILLRPRQEDGVSDLRELLGLKLKHKIDFHSLVKVSDVESA